MRKEFSMIYFLIINCIGFIIMKIDKSKAKHHLYRISEKVLFTVAIIGGSLGVWLGMYLFHHKTKHWYFVWGIPIIVIIQMIIIYKLHFHL